MPECTISPIPGARPIRPGDLEGLWAQEKHDEIINRVKYLVHGDLEEPPHILAARQVLAQKGKTWRNASDEEIIRILERLPRTVFERKFWKRSPQPPPNSAYHDLMLRIHRAELDFYGFDGDCGSGRLLYMIRDTKYDPSPESFYHRLKQAGVVIDKVVHFNRSTIAGNEQNLLKSVPYKLDLKRDLFVSDMAMFLAKMQGRSGKLPCTKYDIPSPDGKYINAIMRMDGRTLLFDTTINNSVLQAVQEAGLKPAVIIKQFTFWPDGADEDEAALERASWADYNTTNWLTQYYDVFERHPGSGFVTCNPTIYIRKGSSVMSALRRSASNLIRRNGSKAGRK